MEGEHLKDEKLNESQVATKVPETSPETPENSSTDNKNSEEKKAETANIADSTEKITEKKDNEASSKAKTVSTDAIKVEVINCEQAKDNPKEVEVNKSDVKSVIENNSSQVKTDESLKSSVEMNKSEPNNKVKTQNHLNLTTEKKTDCQTNDKEDQLEDEDAASDEKEEKASENEDDEDDEDYEEEEENEEDNDEESNENGSTSQSDDLKTELEKKEKNNDDKPIDSRLVPVKKGQFFEHDNRDEDENIENKPENPKPQRSKRNGNKTKNKGAGENKNEDKEAKDQSDKWTHDLFEKHQSNKKSDVKKKISKASKDPKKTTDGTPKKSDPDGSSSKKNKHQKADEKKDENARKSKGLSLSEYLEQNEPSASSNVKSENKSKKSNGKNNNKTNDSNSNKNNVAQKPELMKRLDFSTRKPISSENFTDNTNVQGKHRENQKNDLGNKKFNLKITTDLESSKRIVTETPAYQGNKKKYFTDDDLGTYSNNAIYRPPQSKSYNNQRAGNNGDAHGKFGMTKSNTTHYLSSYNGNSNGNGGKGKDNYDEYYFNDYDVDPADLMNHQQRIPRNNNSNNNNRRSVKEHHDDQFIQPYIDHSNLHIYHNLPQQNPHSQQQHRRRKNDHQANYNEYLDYSGYNNNDFTDYNDQSQMYPIHQQTYMTKSHSFNNGNNNRNAHFAPQQQLHPQFEYNQQYRVNKPPPQQAQIMANRSNYAYQAPQSISIPSANATKSSTRIRFDVNQVPFTPSFASNATNASANTAAMPTTTSKQSNFNKSNNNSYQQ